MNRTKNSGFTLIELMIAVMIIGVLAAIAIPSYQQYVTRSNRTEGMALLQEAAARQERFMTQNNRYATTVAELGYTATGGRAAGRSANNFYQLTIANSASTVEYSMTVVPQGVQASRDSECGTLGLNHAGAKSKTGSGALSDCWK
ncbi:Fimbrial protein precursor [Pseudomonas sp. THAF187a]|uniref:type IV pilin protein n=1 Tax=Pseudomonadaceae TaxID=135621 RepID=UPI001267A26B|nr:MULTISPECIES: type IV pilin protein [unclassified Pseudomonas]QFT20921.1 Fimbrial protein precursor [Pseudomonas sp. THAF187a]QFT41110.1 Fimbrial protein precursor [Pseudomonas sp. THAF42]TNF17112.1 MAG: type IV pilin protein [Pseudomonadales bacterium]WFC61307.1 type IV pilin protein [Pseudomonas sp. REST10]|tara:strand:- start:11451 stop:11885 length:435 start_codon:yes stop_codon:yes gene_type:complete